MVIETLAAIWLAGSVGDLSVLPHEPFRLSAKQAEAVKSAVRRNLKDPESARFDRPFRAARALSDNTVMVCGFVNARNSFGGYTGNSYMIGKFPAGQAPFEVLMIASDRENAAQAQEICQAVGLTLD